MECYIKISDYAISFLINKSVDVEKYSLRVEDNISTYESVDKAREVLKLILNEIIKVCSVNDEITFKEDIITWNDIRIELIQENYL